VAELESFARDAGYERVELETTERQEAARAMYEARGYEETGRRQVLEYTVVGFEKSL
jgi:ribosomal protein S18 acetylase RimI-like enzyme